MIELYLKEYEATLKQLQSRFPNDPTRSISSSVESIYSDGTTTGICREDDRTYRVYAGFRLSGHPLGCECMDSKGRQPCRHGVHFLRQLSNELRHRDLPLGQRILNEEFTPGACDLTSYAPNVFRMELEALDRIIASRKPSMLTPVDELTVTKPSGQTRIAWMLELDDRELNVEPWIQSLDLKSDAWRFSRRRLTSEDRPSEVPSAADIEAIRLIELSEETPAVEVALLFANQNNVFWGHQPVSITEVDATLEFQENDHSVAIRLTGWKHEQMLFCSDNAGMVVDLEQNSLRVFRLGPGESAIIQGVDWLREFPKNELADDLLQRAVYLQSFISVRLPERVAGPFRSEMIRPVLLLKSDELGTIEYGFRIRGEDEVLHRPAIGPMIRSVREDDSKCQLVRTAGEERTLIQDWLSRLNLPIHEDHGRFDSLEQSLEFLERVHEYSNELELLWDKRSSNPPKLLGMLKAENVRVEVSQSRDWFQLSGGCTVGEETIAIAALMASLKQQLELSSNGEFVKIDGHGWVRIEQSLYEALQRLREAAVLAENGLEFDMSAAQAMRELDQKIWIEKNEAWKACLQKLADVESYKPVVPTGLKATLRDYQHEGFCWMRRLAEMRVGGILADDMGLGKTVQTLAVLLDRAALGPSLVIAPTSVGFNWLREATRFAPSLRVVSFREADRTSVLASIGPNDLVICSYGLALRMAKELTKVHWANLVLDEAQAVKNSRSKTAAAIRGFKSDWTLALTGTPIENHLGELWSLFHLIAPGVLGTWQQFSRNFATAIEARNDDDRRRSLRKRIAPFVLRRTKTEVLKDLPSRTEVNLLVELSAEERALYDRVRLSVLGEVDALARLAPIEDERIRLLALITRLRQVACHPALVHESWQGPSAKLRQLQETMLELKEEGHRVLIFSQFTTHLGLIRTMLEEQSISYCYLDGSMLPAARQREVDKFQQGDASAFLISLKAGGTGLNLTAADYVIHMDPWWNPAVENQATDRAHRIGQTRPVMVYRLISRGTIEEEIVQLQEAKRDLVASILDGAEGSAKLSTSDLISLIRR